MTQTQSPLPHSQSGTQLASRTELEATLYAGIGRVRWWSVWSIDNIWSRRMDRGEHSFVIGAIYEKSILKRAIRVPLTSTFPFSPNLQKVAITHRCSFLVSYKMALKSSALLKILMIEPQMMIEPQNHKYLFCHHPAQLLLLQMVMKTATLAPFLRNNMLCRHPGVVPEYAIHQKFCHQLCTGNITVKCPDNSLVCGELPVFRNFSVAGRNFVFEKFRCRDERFVAVAGQKLRVREVLLSCLGRNFMFGKFRCRDWAGTSCS